MRRITAAALLLALKDAQTDRGARDWLGTEDAAQMFEFLELDARWIDDDIIDAAKDARRRKQYLDD